DFLARDIIALQKFDPDKKGKDKLTSTNFQVLQATLAYYGAKKDTIRDMFQRIGLLDGDNPHPFLKEIDPGRYHSIISFYEAYLDNKRCYLEKCKEEGNLDDHQFLRPSRQRYAMGKREVKTIARQLLDNPVNIPKGFFQKKIKELVCDEDSSLNGRKMNTAYMIQAWFEKMQGTQQPLYGYEKTYPMFSKAVECRKKIENLKKIENRKKIDAILADITSEKTSKQLKELISKIPDNGNFEPQTLKGNLLKGCRDIDKNERILRRCKVQDMVTFMMVKETLTDQLAFKTEDNKDKGNPLKLENIIPKTKDDKTIFNRPITCTTEVSIPFGTGETHHDKGYVDFIKNRYEGLYSFIQKNKKIELKYKITSENTKLKDLGKYRRYFYDRRLPGLLIWKYPPNAKSGSEIKYSDIEDQIKAYQQHRLKIAGLLYVLEKKVIERWVSPEELSGEGYISFNQVIEKLKERLPESNDKCDTLLNIRNAVYHNQFPVYEDAIENADGEKIADKMLAVTEDYVNDITKQITQSDKELENV
ncbi:MAG: type VI-B CRISPR-associated RNA-guided ribonuclease Cas13b, partial [Sedimentisphaerales bacterium]|nr:type VI-B CRISPR-associated RNA-guided ribonuclease Cas13b [Sedimentisphaerales bacterium]